MSCYWSCYYSAEEAVGNCCCDCCYGAGYRRLQIAQRSIAGSPRRRSTRPATIAARHSAVVEVADVVDGD